MPMQEVASGLATIGNPIDMGGLVVRAFARRQLNSQAAAGVLGMSPTQFTKSFSANWPDHNPAMKRLGDPRLEVRMVLREFALLLCEDLGITVDDFSAERNALADAMIACANVIRAVKR